MDSNFTAAENTVFTVPPADKAFFTPYLSISATITSVLLAFLYTFLRDVSTAYVKAPKHFPKRGWLVSFAKPQLKLPFVEVKDGNYVEALHRGAEQYPDQPFRIPHHPHEWVILPHRLIDEAKNIPESKLSFQQGSYDFFMGWHTGITNHERVVANILKTGVNRLIDAVYAIVQDESLRTVTDQLGPCEDWTEISLLPKTVGMIMAISQRVFVGEPLCRSQDWLLAIMHVTQNAFGSVPSLWPYSPWTRPFIAWRHPGLKSVRENRENAKKMLKPVLDDRLAKMDEPGFEPPPDLMQFVLEATKKTGEGRSLDYQVNAIIGTGRAALFTTGITIYHLIYDLAARPEYIEILRDEARQFANVPMTRANVNKMTKMDSFIRESQRFSKFMLVGTFRKCMKDITLSDGTFLPEGTYVGTNVEDSTFKHSTLPNPEVFDGLRWHRMRLEQGKENMYSSVQTSSDHLVYGMGNQACPGRFFAAHEARVVTSRIIMNYDFKLAKAYEKGHPMAHAEGVMTTVDPGVKFLFKKRTPI